MSVQTAMLRWFLVLTRPAGEQIAKTNLERQGYRVYYPRLLCPSLHRGRWIERVVALFPRYLFLQLDSATQSLAPVRSTLGVASLVRFGTEARVVPDAIIDDLIRRADPESGLHRLARARPFDRGARVSIIAGAFEGMNGVYERELGEERVVVLLKVLGHDATVRIPSRYVVPSCA